MTAGLHMLKSGKADAVAANKPSLFEMSDQLPGSQVLDGAFATEQVSLGIPKGRTAGLPYLSEFAEDMKSEGLVKAAVERAEEELNNATIRSPIRGIVLSRDVEIGSPVSSILNLGSSATLVMVLGDISQVYVKGKVDETDIGLVKMGQPVRIRVETFKDRSFVGRVTQISPMGVEKDNVVNFEVRASIDNPAYTRYEGWLLRAFKKIPLAPGETATVPLSVAVKDLAWYDADAKRWVIEPMTYGLYVGGSSRSSDLLRASFTVSRPASR